MKDLFIACVDGLTGLPEAIETVYPQTRVQLCMVHLMRNSLRYVSYKHMKEVATDWHPDLLREYRDGSRVQSGAEGSRNGMDSLPALANRGEPDFPRVIPLFAEPSDIRKVIYTTNATPVRQYDAAQSDAQSSHFSAPPEAVYKVV